jgi:chemotaxis protein MotB
MKKLKRNNRKENQGNFVDTTGADRYLITYADMLTLLLGLFVILYASSRVDQGKYKEMSAAFSEYFQVKNPKILQGGDGVLEGHSKGVPEPILAPSSANSIEEIKKTTRNVLGKYIETGSLEIREDKSGITVVLPEKLLFESGKANIQTKALPVLDTLSAVLKNIPFQIMVDGHTDSQPIKTFRYESNWHLSIDRALNVAYELISNDIPQYNLVVRGFGAQRPIAENVSKEGKRKNRRVEITISAKSPEMATETPKKDSLNKTN